MSSASPEELLSQVADRESSLVTLLTQGGSLGAAIADLVANLARGSARNATALAAHSSGACLEALASGLLCAADGGLMAQGAVAVAYAGAVCAVLEGAAANAAPAPAVDAVATALRRFRTRATGLVGDDEQGTGTYGWLSLESRAADRHCAAAIAVCS